MPKRNLVVTIVYDVLRENVCLHDLMFHHEAQYLRTTTTTHFKTKSKQHTCKSLVKNATSTNTVCQRSDRDTSRDFISGGDSSDECGGGTDTGVLQWQERRLMLKRIAEILMRSEQNAEGIVVSEATQSGGTGLTMLCFAVGRSGARQHVLTGKSHSLVHEQGSTAGNLSSGKGSCVQAATNTQMTGVLSPMFRGTNFSPSDVASLSTTARNRLPLDDILHSGHGYSGSNRPLRLCSYPAASTAKRQQPTFRPRHLWCVNGGGLRVGRYVKHGGGDSWSMRNAIRQFSLRSDETNLRCNLCVHRQVCPRFGVSHQQSGDLCS